MAVRAGPRWEAAVQAQLSSLYRRAARPENGHIPAEAGAVRFADEAELLACLALDMQRHVTGQRWWWRALLRTRPSLAAGNLAGLFGSQARLMPAIFNYLAGWGQAAPVVQALTPAQATAVLRAISEAHELSTHGWPTMTDGGEVDDRQPLAPWIRWLPTTAVPAYLGRGV
jgi:hypothetical protein